MKLILVVAGVLMLAVPAMARVDVWCDSNDVTGEITVRYETDANRPRAFALDIDCNNANISNVTVPVDPNTETGYWVYPGDIEIIDGDVNDYGSLVGNPNYPGTQEGSSVMTIEMGSLYVGAPNAPALNGILFTFMVDANDTIDINENTIRGGIVMEDPNEVADPNLCGCEKAPLPPDKCLIEGQVIGGILIDANMVALWESIGEPDCWCYDCHNLGDIDGDCKITTTDILGYEPNTGWRYAWNNSATDYKPCSDIDNSGAIDVTDVLGYEPNTGWRPGWNDFKNCKPGCDANKPY